MGHFFDCTPIFHLSCTNATAMYIVTYFAIGHVFQDSKSFNINNIFPLTSVPKLIGAALIAGCHLKEGGTYFKVKGIVHMNLTILSFSVIFCYKNLSLFYIVLYIPELLEASGSYSPYFSI